MTATIEKQDMGGGGASFKLGPVMFTRSINDWCNRFGVGQLALLPLLRRHARNDSDSPAEDRRLNWASIENQDGGVLSAYKGIGSQDDERTIWISTVGIGTPDCYTTVMFPEDY